MKDYPKSSANSGAATGLALAKVRRFARKLYEEDRAREIKIAKDNNRFIKRGSFLRESERCLPWAQLCKSSGYLGEHPRDRYLRYAETAAHFFA